jgi:hypothetical protein
MHSKMWNVFGVSVHTDRLDIISFLQRMCRYAHNHSAAKVSFVQFTVLTIGSPTDVLPVIRSVSWFAPSDVAASSVLAGHHTYISVFINPLFLPLAFVCRNKEDDSVGLGIIDYRLTQAYCE